MSARGQIKGSLHPTRYSELICESTVQFLSESTVPVAIGEAVRFLSAESTILPIHTSIAKLV